MSRVVERASLLLPAVLMAGLAVASGGFFPDATGAGAVAVLLALVLWLTVVDAPLAGLSGSLALAAGSLAGFAGWTLASGAWSESDGRAVLEYQRALLYLALLVLAGLGGASRWRAGWLVRALAAAAIGVSVAALAVWLFPDTLPQGGVPGERLSWPRSYWNATGLLAAFGVLWALHLSSSPGERPWMRSLAAGAAPLCAATLYFTVSRGAAAALAVGIVVYVLAARSRLLLTSLVCVLPFAVLAVAVAQGVDGLSVSRPNATAIDAGRTAAWQLGLCAFAACALRRAATPLDRRLLARRMPQIRLWMVAAAGAAAVVLALAVDVPGRVADAYDEFVSYEPVEITEDPRQRFTRLGNNGRIDHWRVAIDQGYRADPLKGVGAGTYELQWQRGRETSFSVVDAHSLYIEVLAELGLVGLTLLCASLLAIVIALARRSRGPTRHAWAALLAAAAALLVHAGVDWDWEMPAVMGWLFAAGGVALGRRTEADTGTVESEPTTVDGAGAYSGIPSSTVRIVAALGCLALAALPALAWRSQVRLVDAVAALRSGDCIAASDAALDAAEALPVRAAPLEVLAYCQVRRGAGDRARQSIAAAIRRDPDNWELHYGRALVVGATGGDPRPAARRALRLNPREQVARDLAQQLRRTRRPRWRQVALEAPLPLPDPSAGPP